MGMDIKDEVGYLMDMAINDFMKVRPDGQMIGAALLLLKCWEAALDTREKYESALALEKMAEIAKVQSAYFAHKAEKWREWHWKEKSAEIQLIINQLKSAKPTARALELLK